MADEQSIQLLAPCIQLWQQNLCIPPASSWIEQIIVCVQQHNARVPWCTRESRQMFTVCRRHRDCCQQRGRTNTQHRSNISANTENKTVTLDVKVRVLIPETLFLCRSITTNGITPLKDRIDKFLKNLKLPTSVKSLQWYIGSVQFYRQYIPKLAKKLVPLYKLLQKAVKFALKQVHKDAMFDINDNLTRAAKQSLRLPVPDKQLVIMCDASEYTSGYVLLI